MNDTLESRNPPSKGAKHTATLPDGTVATRTSKTHVYTHIVAVRDHGGPWSAANWCSRRDLAAKYASQQQQYRQPGDVKIIPVQRDITVTLTTEQIDLIMDLLPIPLERELLEEDLSAADKSEVRREMDEVTKIFEILVDAQEVGR